MAVSTNNDVVNIALAKMGEAPITDYTIGTDPVSVAALRNFDRILDMVLTAHPWLFALRIETTLVASTDDADADWTYKYALPADCLRILSILDATRKDTDTLFDTRHTTTQDINVMVTDEEDPTVRFIYQETTVAAWSQYFIEALACRLGAELVLQLSGEQSMWLRLTNMYQMALADARTMDSSQARTDTLDNPNQEFVDARG